LPNIGNILREVVDVQFFDANLENATFEDIQKLLLTEKPDAIVCSVTPQFLPLEAKIAEVCAQTGTKCIVIPILFDYADEVLEKYDFSFAIYSEPEKTMLEWVKGTPLRKLKGIVFKKNGNLIKNPEQQPFYSQCPSMEWDLLDLRKYDAFIYQLSRGCPYTCKFCVWAGRPWQIKPVDTVLEDLKNLEREGVRIVYLLCAQISTNKKWVYKFCQEKVKRGITILWHTDIRANEIDREMMAMFREAGCVSVYMGVESFNQEILDFLDKKLTVKQITEAIQTCKEQGIPIVVPVMFNVGENDKDVDDYISCVKKARPTVTHAGIVKLLRGTRLYEELIQEASTVLDIGVVAMYTLSDVKNAQKRLNRFKNEALKNQLYARVWWYLTNRHARSVFMTDKGGLKGLILWSISKAVPNVRFNKNKKPIRLTWGVAS